MSVSLDTHSLSQSKSGFHDDVVRPPRLSFVLVHVACLGILWTGVSRTGVALLAALYALRMFAVTAGYHRYFSHRTYKTSRLVQFLLAFLAQTSAQRGVLWWAAQHRAHHKHSDTPLDHHSPAHHGFWHSHVGWIFHSEDSRVDYGAVRDLARYPELVLLERFRVLPAFLLAAAVTLMWGAEGLFVGFFASTVLLYHSTFAINSVAHLIGRQRYDTGDDSRNSWWLALLTFGEGWHNNHHYFQASTRQGFRWWQVDITYYILKILSYTRLVWDLREPPPHIVNGVRHAVSRTKKVSATA